MSINLTEPENLPFPPLDPTWYRDVGLHPRALGELREMSRGAIVHQEVIFRMRVDEYLHRMSQEAVRLQRERQMAEALIQKTQIINELREQIITLHTMKLPTVAALREAYANDMITQEELERMLMHVLAGAV